MSCHIKILSVLAQEQQKLESDILYPINVFSGSLTILSKKEKLSKRNFYKHLLFVKNLWRLNCTLNTLKTTYWFPVLSLQNKNGSFVQNFSQMHIFKRCCAFNKMNAKLTLNFYLGLKKCLWLINYLKNCPPNDDVAYVSSFGSLILGNNNRNSPQYWAYPMYHQLSIAYVTFLTEPQGEWRGVRNCF